MTPAEIARPEMLSVYGRKVPGVHTAAGDDRTVESCTGPAPADIIRDLVDELLPLWPVTGRLDRDGIEQGIANGWDDDRIVLALVVPLADVLYVRDQMERISA